MCMVEIHANAEKVIRPTADSSGRVTIGAEYADRQVEVAVLGVVDDDANADGDETVSKAIFGDVHTLAADISDQTDMDYEHVRDVTDAIKRRNGEYE